MRTQIKNCVVLCLCLLSGSLTGCAAGWNHTSDNQLRRFFAQHRDEFELVLAEVQADAKLTTLQRDVLIYADQWLDLREKSVSEVVHTGMTEERWMRYQKQLRDLRLYGVMKGEGVVEFRVDSGSIFNGDSYKGYQFTTLRPHSLRENLDGYRIVDGDKTRSGWLVHSPLQGNWYLYLFVSS